LSDDLIKLLTITVNNTSINGGVCVLVGKRHR